MKLKAGKKGSWSKYKGNSKWKDVKIPGSDRLGAMFGLYGKAVFKLSNIILSALWSLLSPILFSFPALIIIAIVMGLLIFDAIIKFQIKLFWQLAIEARMRFGSLLGGFIAIYLEGTAKILKGMLDSLAWGAKKAVEGVLYCVTGATTAVSGVVLDWVQGTGAILSNKYDLMGNNLEKGDREQSEEAQKKKYVEITYTENQKYEINRREMFKGYEEQAEMLQYSFRFGKYWEQALATGLARKEQLENFYKIVNGESDKPTDVSLNNLIRSSETKAGKIKDVYYWRYRDALSEKEELEKQVREKELNMANTSQNSIEDLKNEIENKKDEKILLQEGLDGIKDESKRQQYKDVEIETIKDIDDNINELEKQMKAEREKEEIKNIINKYKEKIENANLEEVNELSGENIQQEQIEGMISIISTVEGMKIVLEQQIEDMQETYYGRTYYDEEKKETITEEGLEKRKIELENKLGTMNEGTKRILDNFLKKEIGVDVDKDVNLPEDDEKFKKENNYEDYKEYLVICGIEQTIEEMENELDIIDEAISNINSKEKEIQDNRIKKENIRIKIEDLDNDIAKLNNLILIGGVDTEQDESLKKIKENLKNAKEKLYRIYMEDNLLYAIEDDGEFSNENKVNYIMDLYYEDEEAYPELKETIPDLLDTKINDIENTFNRFVGGASGFDEVSIDEALNAMIQKKYGGYGYPKSYYTKKTTDNENVIGAQVYTYEKTAITAPENLKLMKIYKEYEPIEKGKEVVCMNFTSEDGAREYKVMGIEEISKFFNAKVKLDYKSSSESGDFYEIKIGENNELLEVTPSGEKSFDRNERDYTYEHIIIPEGTVIGTFGKSIVPLSERRKAEDIQKKITEEQMKIDEMLEGENNDEQIEIAKNQIATYREELEQIKKGDVYDYIFVELNEDSTNSVLDVEPDFIIPVYEKGKYRFAMTKKEKENGLGSRIYGGAIVSDKSGSVQNIGYTENGSKIDIRYENGLSKTYSEEDDNIITFSDTTKNLLDKIDPYWDSKYYVFDEEIDIEKGEFLGLIPKALDPKDNVGVYANGNYKILEVNFRDIYKRDKITSFKLLDIKTKDIVEYKVIESKNEKYRGEEIQKLGDAMFLKLRKYDKYRIKQGELIAKVLEYTVEKDNNNNTNLKRKINEIRYLDPGYCEILEVGRDDNGLLRIKLRTIPDYKIKEYIGLVSVGSKVLDKLDNVFNRNNDNYSPTVDSIDKKYNQDYIYSYAKWDKKYYDVNAELAEKRELKKYLTEEPNSETQNIEKENKIAAKEAIAFKGRIIKMDGNGDLYFDDLGEETEIIAPENCIVTMAGWNKETGYTLQLTSLDYERRYTFSELSTFSSWVNGILGNKLGADWRESGKFEEVDEYRIIEKGEIIGRMGASKGPTAGDIPMIAPETLRVTKFGRIKEDGEEKYCVLLESLDGKRVYEIKDMDVLSQMANTSLKGDLRKSNRKVQLIYTQVDYDKCYMLSDQEVIEKEIYTKACESDGVSPGSTISNSEETEGKGYGIRPLYIYEGEIIGYAKMKDVQNVGERYATGNIGKKLKTKITTKDNKVDDSKQDRVYKRSNDLINQKKAKVTDLFDAVHVNVFIERFDNLLPDNFEQKITSRIVSIQNIERTTAGFDLKYREGNHRVDKIVCFDNNGKAIVTNKLVYAEGNKRIDEIEYYTKEDESDKKKIGLKNYKSDNKEIELNYERVKKKDEETNSDVIELTIPISVPNNADKVAKIVIYDSTGNTASCNIMGVTNVQKNDDITTVTVVSPKEIGVRQIELYDEDKNLITSKDIEYKNRSQTNYDFSTDKTVDQVKLYGYDGKTRLWKPEITYVNKVNQNTIKVAFVEGMKGVSKVEYYDSNNNSVSLQSSDLDETDKTLQNAVFKQGSGIDMGGYESEVKVPNAYDIKKILIYDKEGKYTEYKCLAIEGVILENENIINVAVSVDKSDGVESIECYNKKGKLVLKDDQGIKNKKIYSIDVSQKNLSNKDIKEIKVYSTNKEEVSYTINTEEVANTTN